MQPGSIGSCVPRGPGKSPVWFIKTPRGPGGLSLDEDQILDIEQIELEDYYFPNALSWVQRAADFLRSTTHDALPAYVDAWHGRGGRYSRAALVDGKLTSRPYDGPTFYVATRRVVGLNGWEYLRHHRLPGAGLPVFVAVRIVERIADLCRIAHSAGLVHGGLALAAVLIRPNGRPILERWSGTGWRARDNVGFDFEGLWSIKKALGLDPAAASMEDDVFRLGCLLSTLLTGRPPFDEEDRGFRYRPPSSRIRAPAALDDMIGAACDPARGYAASAASLQRSLALFLAEGRPPLEHAREILREGDFVAFADLVARYETPDVPDLIEQAAAAVARYLISALRRGHPAPLYSEFLLSEFGDARGAVRDAARDRELSWWIRASALSLLVQVDDAGVVPLAVAMGEGGSPAFGAVGWSARPQLVREDGRICPHPWTSLVGDPIMDSEQPRRTCSLCGPLLFVDAWMAARIRTMSAEVVPEPELWLDLDDPEEGDACVELKPGFPHFIAASPTATVFIDGLDPVHHAFLAHMGGRLLWCALGVAGYGGLELARTAVIDASLKSDAVPPLRIGPVEFVVTAPGRIKIRPDRGVRILLNGPRNHGDIPPAHHRID